MTKTLLLAFMFSVFSLGVHAAQIKQATDNGQITAIISALEISRISLAGDRVRMVNGDPDVNITHDAETGDIYLKPANIPLNKPLNLFITSEKGFTYQLLLMPEKVPSEQILIRNDNTRGGSEEARAFESKTPFYNTVIDLIRAITGNTDLPPGFKKKLLRNTGYERREQFKLRPLYTVTGSALQGIAVQVRSTRDTVATLSESTLFQTDHAAIYLPKRRLEPGETITVYLVRRRGGSRS